MYVTYLLLGLGNARASTAIKKISEKKIGTIISEETKEKMRNSSNKGGFEKTLICPYCNKEGGGNTMFRWHFKNCKKK
jgi:hypothetical protein